MRGLTEAGEEDEKVGKDVKEGERVERRSRGGKLREWKKDILRPRKYKANLLQGVTTSPDHFNLHDK